MNEFPRQRASLTLVAIIALAVSCAPAAQADSIFYGPTVFDNGGAGYHTGATGTFTVPQFDDLGGTRPLTKVTLFVTIDSTGGQHEFDSEALTSATITLGIGAGVSVQGPDPIIGSRLVVSPNASETLTGFITADDDGFGPSFGGTDYLSITGTHSTDTQSGFRTAAEDLAPYIGTGDAAFAFDHGLVSTKGTSALPDGWDRVTFGTTRFTFTTTVLYDYVSEPATLSLLTIGALGFIGCLRRRHTK